jgi:hypothetical protein
MKSNTKSRINKNRKFSKRVSKKVQKGGVGFTFDNGCRVGGLPARVATSDCPNVGPLSSCHIKAAYGQSCTGQVGGARRNGRTRKSSKFNRASKSNKSNKSSRSSKSNKSSKSSKSSKSRKSNKRNKRR